MAVNHDPILKRCRALDLNPAVLGYNKKSNRNPEHGMNGKLSEYGIQLREKQKLKFIYGVMEKPFYHYYELAEQKAGATGENLLAILETRLDNIAWRMGMASTRRDARQLVTHGHFTLNGKKITIPSVLVKPGDVIAVKESSRDLVKFKTLAENLNTLNVPKWLEVNADALSCKVVAMPTKEDLDYEVNEQLVVELYSK